MVSEVTVSGKMGWSRYIGWQTMIVKRQGHRYFTEDRVRSYCAWVAISRKERAAYLGRYPTGRCRC